MIMKNKLAQLRSSLAARILPAHVRASFLRILLSCLSAPCV